MPQNVILVGSEGHCKTTVAAALARALDTKLPQNLFTSETASTINLAIADKTFAVTHCTSHEEIKQTLSSTSTKFTTAVLVVSVIDGVQTHTRDHIELCEKHGVRGINVWLNMYDMVGAGDVEFVDMLEEEITELLGEKGYETENIFVIGRGSALKALQGEAGDVESIKELLSRNQLYVDSKFRRQPVSGIDLES